MSFLEHEKVECYLSIPEEELRGSSDNLAAFRADDSKGFAQYGISEGMYIIVDLDKPYSPGKLSCYSLAAAVDEPKIKIAHIPPEGYHHLGQVVLVRSDIQ